jgi:hypothetical protein
MWQLRDGLHSGEILGRLGSRNLRPADEEHRAMITAVALANVQLSNVIERS